MLDRNASISARNTSASRRSAPDALSTSLAAEPASAEAVLTPTMLLETSTCRGGVLDVAGDLARRRPLLFDRGGDRGGHFVISPMVSPMFLIAPTAEVVTCCMLAIWARISSVAFAVWLARLLTSEATTAKPRPLRRRARPRWWR